MKRLLLILAATLLLASGTVIAQSTIATGPHDFSAGSALRNADATINAQTCVFCHTPHGGSLSIPLWNRSNSAATYQLYTSTTMDSTPVQPNATVSGACLSCHDGTIGVDVLTNVNGTAFSGVAFTAQGTAKATYGNSAPGSSNLMASGLPYMGTDLRNDHPIAITYETARAATPTEFVTQALVGSKITVGAVGPLPLFGTTTANATVECASCHNPHNNSNTNFLRKSNAGSAICLTCHIK